MIVDYNQINHFQHLLALNLQMVENAIYVDESVILLEKKPNIEELNIYDNIVTHNISILPYFNGFPIKEKSNVMSFELDLEDINYMKKGDIIYKNEGLIPLNHYTSLSLSIKYFDKAESMSLLTGLNVLVCSAEITIYYKLQGSFIRGIYNKHDHFLFHTAPKK